MSIIQPKVLLLIVENRDYILTEYAKWLVDMAWDKKVGGIKFWEGNRKPIWYMRKELIRWALKNTDCTHLLFVDTDAIPPEGFLERLLLPNCDVISGVCPHVDGSVISRKNGKPYKGKGLEEVDVCETGIMLMKREVAEKVEHPPPDNVTIDSDIEFCREIKKNKFKIFQDFDLKCSHLLLAKF